MNGIEIEDIEISFEGKSYPSNLYIHAYTNAMSDPGMQKEISDIQRKYLQKHLETLLSTQTSPSPADPVVRNSLATSAAGNSETSENKTPVTENKNPRKNDKPKDLPETINPEDIDINEPLPF